MGKPRLGGLLSKGDAQVPEEALAATVAYDVVKRVRQNDNHRDKFHKLIRIESFREFSTDRATCTAVRRPGKTAFF